MATTNYDFPTVQSTDRIAASAINNLATAVDSALKTVDDKASGGEAYVLPPATASTLGGVKVGSGVSVTGDGTISVQGYTLPAATADTLGGVKVGTGLSASAGVLSVNATWIEQKVADAIQGYMRQHFAQGATWGNIESYGFIYDSKQGD